MSFRGAIEPMSAAKRRSDFRARNIPAQQGPKPNMVPSLFDAIQDGNEYGSIVGLVTSDENLSADVRRAIAQVEAIRGRRCICYVANVINPKSNDYSITASDHLPFNEMINLIPQEVRDIDVFLVTPGGTAETVIQFVDALRSRFNTVEFLLPYQAMSAGTLWALSGERIWMDRRACLGPVDPQVRSKDGSFVPAQALLTLFNEIQRQGNEALARKQDVPWAFVRLLDNMDHRQLGHALTSTRYVVDIAKQYLEMYKFRYWDVHSTSKLPVTEDEKKERAIEVSAIICDHQRWKAHGHAINRDAVYSELQIKIDKLEDINGLESAIRKLWAIFYYVFDRSPALKIMASQEYTFVRSTPHQVPGT
jgi:hypothetical protein